MWTELLGTLVKPLSDWAVARENRKIKDKEIDDAEHARTVDAIAHSEDLEQALTLAQINQSGWKDEWFTILLSVPLVLAFVPRCVPLLQAGFAVLETMPVWYKGFLGAAIAAAFGLKTIDKAWSWWKSP